VYEPYTGEIMVARLNIKVADLFDKTALATGPDNNFVPGGVQLPGDFMDV